VSEKSTRSRCALGSRALRVFAYPSAGQSQRCRGTLAWVAQSVIESVRVGLYALGMLSRHTAAPMTGAEVAPSSPARRM